MNELLRFTRGLVLVAAAALLASWDTRTQEAPLAPVLARAGAYVTELHRQLSGIVGEERYEQDAETPRGADARSRSLDRLHRELKSDFLLVRPSTATGYVEFRDVFEVDGRPVRDRQERLTKLFLDPSASSTGQLERIVFESARYNIGTVYRTINTPTLPLLFLDPVYQPRFTFRRSEATTPILVRDRELSPTSDSAWATVAADLWVVEYQEGEWNTVVRTVGDRNLPSQGRFWIEPETGRVLLTELVLRDSELRATIDVAYRAEPGIAFLVPGEMRERYEGRRDGALIEGTATYSKFRRFLVQAEETVDQAEETVDPDTAVRD